MMPLRFAAFVAVLVAFAAGTVRASDEPSEMDKSFMEDARLNFTQLATKYGYPSEIHTVRTSDGYLLTVHRIPYGKACGPGKDKVPVLLQHGLFCSSDDFIIMGPKKGLGYILADECYDVWLGNSRGNSYSRKHVSMNVKNKKFWEFSWHEMGSHDLPAMIDYITKKTGHPSIHYVGHSQGTTQFFIFGSLHPQYHSKIRSAHALSPVAFMKNLKSPALRALTIFHKPIHTLCDLVGIHEFFPTCQFLNLIGMNICKEQYPAFQAICQSVLFLIAGSNPALLNATMLPVIIGHTPAGASTRQLVHYAQGIQKDGFRMYDHGALKNIVKYGSIEPPSYKLDKINIPIAFYFSDNDWLADVKDVDRLADILPNLIGKFRIHHKLFGHLDYLWAVDVKPLVYDNLIKVLRRY
ncbi:UNVERIFIED_CONTAM: hypothetical protein PYX00_006081 [Menopon gallinae]|uniref:Lipase n=1 Tax=Menopon gallinae TaxID=328185 RepID=A0AAW2HV38_9NEOP